VAWLDYETADDVVVMTMTKKVVMQRARWRKVSMGSRHASEDNRHLHPNTSHLVEHTVIALKRLRMAVVLALLEVARSHLAVFPDGAGSVLAILASHHLQRWLVL
jgi:hypothetical protein